MSTTDRDEWLKERRNGIGGSDIVRIIDRPFPVWANKMGLDFDRNDDETDAMWLGNVLEDHIVQWLRNEFPVLGITGYKDKMLYAHDEYDWARYTPDGRATKSITNDIHYVLECKYVGAGMRKNWVDGIPQYVQDQVQWGMFVMGYPMALVGAVVGGERKYGWVERDEKRIKFLFDVGQEFWGLVQSETPPAVDGSEQTSDLISRMNPEVVTQTIQLSNDLWGMDQEYDGIVEQIKELEDRKNEIRNKVLLELGENAIGQLPNSVWTRSKSTRKAYVVAEKEIVTLRRKERKQ